jgi:hypothetical protein
MVEDSSSVAAGLRSAAEANGIIKGSVSELLDMFGLSGLTDDTAKTISERLAVVGLQSKPEITPSLKLNAKVQIDLTGDARRTSRAEALRVRYAINPAGVALACVGALIMAIAAFLPLDEPASRLTSVQENALIHHGGWVFLALGAGIGVNAYRQYSAGRLRWTVVVLGVIALALAIWMGADKGNRTLVEVGCGSSRFFPENCKGEVVPLGLAIYVAGAGACAAILGGWIMRQSPSGDTQAARQTLKRCPDCAETIQAAARVCKHCGRRFDDAPPPATISSA